RFEDLMVPRGDQGGGHLAGAHLVHRDLGRAKPVVLRHGEDQSGRVRAVVIVRAVVGRDVLGEALADALHVEHGGSFQAVRGVSYSGKWAFLLWAPFRCYAPPALGCDWGGVALSGGGMRSTRSTHA